MAFQSGRAYKRAIALAATCSALLLVGAQTAAAAPCASPQAAPVFAQFGDLARYTSLPGGSFEGPIVGWSLSGASVVQGNEPWYVRNIYDAQSLNIASGGSATTGVVCVNATRPSWRFFAVSQDPSATLNIALQYTDSTGATVQLPAATLNGGDYSAWAPTPPLALSSLLPANATSVKLVFQATGSGWNIDDLYLDPYAR